MLGLRLCATLRGILKTSFGLADITHPHTMPNLHIYMDESGNTGADLLNADQPLFALAATSLDAGTAAELVAPLIKQGQKEAKYAKLKGTASGQKSLLKFFSSAELKRKTTRVMLADKRYYVVTHMVDKLIEPPLYEAGIDLYAGDAHVGLVNVWLTSGPYFFPNGHWEKLLRALVAAFRQRTPEAFKEFDRVLLAAVKVTPEENRDFVTGLLLAHGRLPKFLGVFKSTETFDPAVDLFISMINSWMADHPGMLDLTHDRSKPLKHSEAFLRTMMKPLPARRVGYGSRQAELPLRVANFNFGDSKDLVQLQVADVVAGAAVDCLMAWSGRRPASEFHEAMKATQLEHLLADGMLPNFKIERLNDPAPGEVSLVDGSAAFLKEAGYF